MTSHAVLLQRVEIPMRKKGEFLILSVVLWATALWASPIPREPKAIALGDFERSTGDAAQPSSRGKGARKARTSLASAGLPRCAVLNKRLFLMPESAHSKT